MNMVNFKVQVGKALLLELKIQFRSVPVGKHHCTSAVHCEPFLEVLLALQQFSLMLVRAEEAK